MTMVTWDNYEEYLVMLADGELDAAGQMELEEFMTLHPEVREELALFETVHLTPDTTQVFENKESLLRSEPKGMVINLNQWFRYGAAAGMLALVAFGATKWQQSQDNTTEVANNMNVNTNTPPVLITDTPVNTIVKEQPIAKQEKAPVKQHHTVPHTTIQTVQVAAVKENTPMLPKDEAPLRLHLATAEKIQSEPLINELTAQVKELPKIQISEPAPEPDHEALAWLPLDQERKQGLSEVKDALSERLEKAKAIRDNIRNTDMAVKFGKKELFVVRF